MPALKNILVKYFEEPFVRAELHRAEMTRKTTTAKKGYQENLAFTLSDNHRAFKTWATK